MYALTHFETAYDAASQSFLEKSSVRFFRKKETAIQKMLEDFDSKNFPEGIPYRYDKEKNAISLYHTTGIFSWNIYDYNDNEIRALIGAEEPESEMVDAKST